MLWPRNKMNSYPSDEMTTRAVPLVLVRVLTVFNKHYTSKTIHFSDFEL
jgi:hypothetical protein